MKFHELEEGKKYIANGYEKLIYSKKEGLLWLEDKALIQQGWSELSIRAISEMDFTEIPNYVTFEKAIEHMSLNKGANECLFKRSKFIITLGDELQSWDYHGNFTEDRTFTLDMLEPKWIIL